MYTKTPKTHISQSNSEASQDDPIRMARDHWVVRHGKVSDSTEIIDSIDIDMIDATEDVNATEIYLVIDTNVFINNLPVLKQALACINADVARLNVVMLVPGIVVSELDYQKTSGKSIANESRRASSWLATEISRAASRVRGQAYTQTMLPSGDWRKRNGLSNDELILDCCKYFTHVKRKDVLLCTSDNNLAVQASANAMTLFFREVSAVIRPTARLWDPAKLLECLVPGFGKSAATSMHAFDSSRATHDKRSTIDTSSATSMHTFDSSRATRGKRSTIDTSSATSMHAFDSSSATRGKRSTIDTSSATFASSNTTPYPVPSTEDHESMEVDANGYHAALDNILLPLSPKNRRDVLHRMMVEEIGQYLRKLTGKAAKLQQYRREHESIYSSSNESFTGMLPTESDWSHAWCLRDCLTFLTQIPPLQRRSWSFKDGEASSLADFLGLPGENGARPGREWAKYDWRRELLMVTNLAKAFEFEDLDQSKMAQYEYAVMEVFAT